MRPDGGGADRRRAPRSSSIRALAAADRANNAVLQAARRALDGAGRPDRGRADRRRAQGRPGAPKRSRRGSPRVGEVPFSSERKLMSTVHSDAERQERLLVFTKGAPDVLLARCSQELVGEETRPLTAERRAAILAANEELAGEALRTLGRRLPRAADGGCRAPRHSTTSVEQDLVFLGLDRHDRPAARRGEDGGGARRRRAGIRPIMITGDHPEDRRGHRRRARHRQRRAGRHRRGARADVGRRRSTATVREVSVYARVESRAQAADRARRCSAAARPWR